MMTRDTQATLDEAIILAGGVGSRLRDVVKDRPKPLAVVAGKPFIEWLLLLLRNEGIRRVILSTGHLGDMIESHLGSGSQFGVELVYVRDPTPLGTGGALRNALHALRATRTLVLNGDSYCRIHGRAMAEFHTAHRSKITILVANVPDASRFGTVDVDGGSAIRAFREKMPDRRPGLINAGVYLVNREVVEGISASGSVSLERQVFPGMIGHGLYAMRADGPFWDIGTGESYALADSVLSGEFTELQRARGNT